MCHYTHLTPFEQEKILFFLAEGTSITEIARLLKRSKSTISRELRRNAAPVDQPMPYCPLTAQALYKQRREACHPHKRLEHATLHSHPDLHLGVPLVARGDCRTDPVGAWLPSRQRSDDLPRYPRRTAEPVRSFSEVRTSETTASRETASQERQRRTSWQVRHIAPHRRASCQCSEQNTNGLLREFFPKGKDITDTPEDYIQRNSPPITWIPYSRRLQRLLRYKLGRNEARIVVY